MSFTSIFHTDRDRASPGHDHVSTLYLSMSFTSVFYIAHDRVLPDHNHLSTQYLYMSFTSISNMACDSVARPQLYISTQYLYMYVLHFRIPHIAVIKRTGHNHVSTQYRYMSFTSISHMACDSVARSQSYI